MARLEPMTAAAGTLVDLLPARAADRGERPLYVYLRNGEAESEVLTYAGLLARAQGIASALVAADPAGGAGERVLLLFPPGLDFVCAFFGCLLAGRVAVPGLPPKSPKSLPRLLAVLGDAQPRAVLGTRETLRRFSALLDGEPALGTLRQVAIEDTTAETPALRLGQAQAAAPRSDDLAFLQYTSGSTADPKGVMVSHANLVHNEQLIQSAFGTDAESVILGWLPHYHDMGLIGNLLHPIYLGARCVLMPPDAFLQRPVRWLEAIGRYRATVSGGPNFAYDLCVDKIAPADRGGLDLSSWRVAFNGAEPIRAETLDRFAATFAPHGFRREAFYCCYGLAEATLFVTGGAPGAGPTVATFDRGALEQGRAAAPDGGEAVRRVASGRPGGDTAVRIVDGESGHTLPPGAIGEIVISGPSVAQGYWRRPAETERDFRFRPAGEPALPFLRTGDLGFLSQGELFVTGRAKDLIIVRGRNVYPQDLEECATRSHPALASGLAAAFSRDSGGRERIVLVCEVDRHAARGADLGAIALGVAAAITEEHEVAVDEVVLVRAGGVPRTTSGKVRRSACRALLADGDLPILERLSTGAGAYDEGGDPLPPVRPAAADAASLLAYLTAVVARALGGADSPPVDRPLAALGLDSLALLEIGHRIESDLGIAVPLGDLLAGETLAGLSRRLAEIPGRGPERSARPDAATAEGPLTEGQRALWFLHRLEPESSAHHLTFAARLPPGFDAVRLATALRELADRHEALRTSYPETLGEPRQRVHPPGEIDFAEISGLEPSMAALAAAAAEVAAIPFGLEERPPFRVRLLSSGGDLAAVVATVHHIAADLWSFEILLAELSALLAGGSPGPVGAQAPAFARWHQEYLATAEGDRQAEFWRALLAPISGGRALLPDRPRPRLLGARRASSVRIVFDPATVSAWRGGADGLGVTPFALVLAAFQALLGRYSGASELAVAVPASGRGRPWLAEVVGYLTNPLLLPARLGDNPPFRTFLAEVHETLRAALDHQEYPVSRVIEELRRRGVAEAESLLDLLFVWNASRRTARPGLSALLVGGGDRGIVLDGAPWHPLPVERREIPAELQITVMAEGEALILQAELAADLLDGATALRLLEHLGRLLSGAVAAPEARLSDLPLLAPEEIAQLRAAEGRGAAVRRPLLHEMIAAAAERFPDRIAVAAGGEALSYADLARRAARVAAHLRARGVLPDERVGLLAARTPRLLVGLFGILQAGGALLPLDSRQPPERAAALLAHGRARFLVADRSLLGAGPWPVEIADLGALADLGHEPPTDRIREARIDEENLAYVIYTSGSTGAPKGVGVPHRAISAYTETAAAQYDVQPEDRVLQFASLAFDASAEEIYPTLSRGATLVLRDDRMLASPRAFLDAMAVLGTTVLDLPTLYWHEITAAFEVDPGLALPRSVRLVILGGERAQTAALAVWRSRVGDAVRLVNTYGPTEATIVATACDVAGPAAVASDDSVPIGRPVACAAAVVLDRRLHPLPVGICGELFLGGASLARGYLDLPAATAERFVPDPAATRAGQRLYRTGDLARRRADGLLEFVGRSDLQLKVRGFRVEPGEIEACLHSHPAIRRAAVIGRSDGRASLGLAAYFALEPGASATTEELRRYLRERLPDYMVPATFTALAELPTTVGGKIDRRALAAVAPSEPESVFSAPQTPTEELLAALWVECLGRDRIGRAEDFFALGGHSLLATQVISRIRGTFGVDLPLRAIFEAPTVAALAAVIDQTQRRGVPPILPVPRDRALPLSFAQERLWLLDQLNPGSVAYLVPRIVHVGGRLDGAAISFAYEQLVVRHETLRTVFPIVQGQPSQLILPPGPFQLPQIDLRALAEDQRAEAARHAIDREIRRPFDLSAGPILRAVWVNLDDQASTLIQTEHHIVHDGWTQGVFLDDLLALYQAGCRGVAADLPVLPIQYADFAVWQREWLTGEVLEEQLAYWRAHLDGAPQQIGLPSDRPRPVVASHRGNTRWFEISPEVTRSAEGLARHSGATLFMALLAGFVALLARLTGRDDLVVGTPIANRTQVETEGLLGFFVNSLPLRFSRGAEATGEELLAHVRDVTLGGYAHQQLPFELMVASLAPERTLAFNPIFQVMFILQNAPVPPLELPGLSLRYEELHNRTAKFDLVLSLQERDGGLAGWIEYSVDLFDEATILRRGESFERVLSGLAEAPGRRLADLPLLSPAERQAVVVEWAGAVSPEPSWRVPGAVIERAAARPDAIAVHQGDAHLSYGELKRRSVALAALLRRRGVTTDRAVGVCLDRVVELPIAVLAVGLAGGGCLPLDPTYPPDRLAYMVQDSGLRVLITRGAVRAKLPEALLPAGTEVIDLDLEAAVLGGARSAPVFDGTAAWTGDRTADRTAAASLLYILYTSGSTGRPKGVGMSQGAFANLMSWQLGEPGHGVPLRTIQFAALSFDVSFQELYATLIAGGALVLVDPEVRRDAAALLAFLTRGQVERMFLPFVALHQIAEAAADAEVPGSLVEIVTAGEQLQVTEPVVRFFERLPQARLYNQYGPTEAHVVSSLTLAGPADRWPRLPPIGRPVANLRLVVLDRTGGEVPIGVAGELALGGAGVARGYLGRPDATAERFVPDPQAGVLVPRGARVYLTGDLCRFLATGEVEYLGRKDHQVKVRGFRVEPGEIEAAIASHPSVLETAVVARPSRVGGHRLVAYVVRRPAARGRSAEDLDDHLRGRLPEPMVPAVWIELPALPLTPSGKVDRASLPDADESPEGAGRHVAPRNATEEIVAGIFAEVLGVPRVGSNDGFFALGGHSLLGTRVTSRLRRAFGMEVPLSVLFDRPTVAALAAEIETRAGAWSGRPVLQRSGARQAPLSFGQERLWFLDQFEGPSGIYCIPIRLRLSGAIDPRALALAASRVVARHEILRTRLAAEDGTPYQVVEPPRPIRLPEVDLMGMPDSDAEAERLSRAEGVRPFSLARPPMLRLLLLRRSPGVAWWLLTLHHVAADGWSIEILLREIAAFCRGESLPELPIQYADYAAWQRGRDAAERLAFEEGWWRRQLAGAPPSIDLPTDRPRGAAPSYRGVRRSFDRPLPTALLAVCRQHHSTLFMGFLSVLQILLARISGNDDLVIGTPVAGRSQVEIEGLIGFFVNLLALRGRFDPRAPFAGHLERTRAETIGALAHQSVPFERLVEVLQPERDPGRPPIFQVLLTYHNQPVDLPELPGVAWNLHPVDAGIAKYDLALTLLEVEGRLWCAWEVALDLFDPATVARLDARFGALLAHAARAPETPVEELDLWTAEELHQLRVEGNDSLRPFAADRVSGRVRSAGRDWPDRIAVVSEERHLSYGELGERTAAVAAALGRRGLGAEDRVGISLGRSERIVIAALGAHRAGCAYVPLDPEYPAERLRSIAEDAGLALVLAEAAEPRDSLAPGEPNTERVSLEGLLQEPAPRAAERSPDRFDAASDGLAYVLFTSGSTGRPKGVAVTHRSLANFLDAMATTLAFGPEDRILSVTSLSFDIAGLELFLPLWVGGTVEIAAQVEVRDGELLRERLAQSEARLLQATPATWQMLLDSGWPGDRHLLAGTGGEALPEPLAERLLDRSEALWNLYGPTETTIYSTTWRAAPRTPISLGNPLANSSVYVLDRGARPVGWGCRGEIHLGGLGLARGYFDRPDLTAERFVPDGVSGMAGARLYATGDRGRWGAHLEYLGRADWQVKLRGHRIELGEIEVELGRRPGVHEAAVAVVEDRLFAYWVPEAEGAAEEESLRRGLRERLPAYMVPAIWIELAALPRTPNGKVDRKRLPKAPPETSHNVAGTSWRTPIEERIAGIFARVLGRDVVGREADFFALGGHSLLAARVVSRLRDELGVEVGVRTLFEAPRIADLAERLGTSSASPPPIARGESPYPLSFAQLRLWLDQEMSGRSAAYNIPLAFELAGPLDERALDRVLAALLRRHEILRTRIVEVPGGEPVQGIVPVGVRRHRIDLSGLPGESGGAAARRAIEAEARRPFDLRTGPLWRLLGVRLERERHRFGWIFHHLVMDAWSLGVLVREIAAHYAAETGGAGGAREAEPALQYGDYARWQRGRWPAERIERELAYWVDQLRGVSGAPLVAEDGLDVERPSERAGQRTLDLAPDAIARLRRLGQERGATLFMCYLAGLVGTLAERAGVSDLVIGSAMAQRGSTAVEGLVGPCLNLIALRVTLGDDPTFEELLACVRATCIEAYSHQELPFEQIVEALRPKRRFGRLPLIQVVCTMQNAVDEVELGPGFDFRSLPIERGVTPFDLNLNLFERGADLRAVLEYRPDLFQAATVEQLLGRIHRWLALAAERPELRSSELAARLADEDRADRLTRKRATTSAIAQRLRPGSAARSAAGSPNEG